MPPFSVIRTQAHLRLSGGVPGKETELQRTHPPDSTKVGLNFGPCNGRDEEGNKKRKKKIWKKD